MNGVLVFSCCCVFLLQYICARLSMQEASVSLTADEHGFCHTSFSQGFAYSLLLNALCFSAISVTLLFGIIDQPETYWPFALIIPAGFAALAILYRDYQSTHVRFNEAQIEKLSAWKRECILWREVDRVSVSHIVWHALELRAGHKVIRISFYSRGFKTVVAHVRRSVSQAVQKPVADALSRLDGSLD